MVQSKNPGNQIKKEQKQQKISFDFRFDLHNQERALIRSRRFYILLLIEEHFLTTSCEITLPITNLQHSQLKLIFQVLIK